MKSDFNLKFSSGLKKSAENYEKLKKICDEQDNLLDYVSSPKFFTSLMVRACRASETVDDFSFRDYIRKAIQDMVEPLDAERKLLQPEFVSSLPLFAQAFERHLGGVSGALERLKNFKGSISDERGKIDVHGLMEFIALDGYSASPADIYAAEASGRLDSPGQKTPFRCNSRRKVLAKLFTSWGNDFGRSGMSQIYCRAFSVAANLRSSGLLPEGLAGEHDLILPMIFPALDMPRAMKVMEEGYARRYSLERVSKDAEGTTIFSGEFVVASRERDGRFAVSDAPSPVTLALATLEAGGVMKKVEAIHEDWTEREKDRGISFNKRDRFFDTGDVRDARDFLKGDHAKDFLVLASSPSIASYNDILTRIAPFVLNRLEDFISGGQSVFTREENGWATLSEAMQASICSMARDMIREYAHDSLKFAEDTLQSLDAAEGMSDDDANAPRA